MRPVFRTKTTYSWIFIDVCQILKIISFCVTTYAKLQAQFDIMEKVTLETQQVIWTPLYCVIPNEDRFYNMSYE